MASFSVSPYKCTAYKACYSMRQQLKKPCAISFDGGFVTPKGTCSRMPAMYTKCNHQFATKGLHLLAVRAERTCGRDKKIASSLAEIVQVMQSAEEEGTDLQQEQQDWRAFRAALLRSPSPPSSCTPEEDMPHVPRIWAHEIVRPEQGCLLMATPNLDTHPLLRKSIVLLTQAPHQHKPTWTGHLINKPLPYPIAGVVGIDDDVALGLGLCPAFLGGSILASSTSSIHSMTAFPLCGHRPLLPGLHLGSGDTALLAAWAGIQQQIITPPHVRVLVGQFEWDAQTLNHELDVLQWWSIVSCHSSLLLLDNVDCMWDTLQSLLGTCNPSRMPNFSPM